MQFYRVTEQTSISERERSKQYTQNQSTFIKACIHQMDSNRADAVYLEISPLYTE